jgi:hypothetical protein
MKKRATRILQYFDENQILLDPTLILIFELESFFLKRWNSTKQEEQDKI